MRRTYKSIRKLAWDMQSKRKRLEEPFCVTCGGPAEQLGHFIHGTCMDFEETGLHSQCVRCNHFLNGNLVQYTLFMVDKYGRGEVERLKNLKKMRSKGYKIPEQWLLDKIYVEKKRIKELEGK